MKSINTFDVWLEVSESPFSRYHQATEIYVDTENKLRVYMGSTLVEKVAFKKVTNVTVK